jgi:hypothetical protein
MHRWASLATVPCSRIDRGLLEHKGAESDGLPGGVAHQFSDLSHLQLEHILHLPVGRHAGDLEEEVAQQGMAFLAVYHLWVILEPEQLPLSILDAYNRSLRKQVHHWF